MHHLIIPALLLIILLIAIFFFRNKSYDTVPEKTVEGAAAVASLGPPLVPASQQK